MEPSNRLRREVDGSAGAATTGAGACAAAIGRSGLGPAARLKPVNNGADCLADLGHSGDGQLGGQHGTRHVVQGNRTLGELNTRPHTSTTQVCLAQPSPVPPRCFRKQHVAAASGAPAESAGQPADADRRVARAADEPLQHALQQHQHAGRRCGHHYRQVVHRVLQGGFRQTQTGVF